MSRPLRAWTETRICRCCSNVQVHCPGCGIAWEVHWPLPVRSFPDRLAICCDGPSGCGRDLGIEAVGWGPPLPPSPEAARPADLSDRRQLERLWQQPGPQASPPPHPHPRPCPPGADRHRLAAWDARGWLPDGVAPCAVAAAYCRVFGKPAPRDPSKRTARSYSERELGLALGELGLAFEAEPLRVVWRRALERLELPSTRMLLSQQARLRDIRGPVGTAAPLWVEVAVGPDWLETVRSRRQLLSDALAGALGQPVRLALEVQP